MTRPRVKLNLRGINAVMTSPAAQAEVDRLGEKIVGNADGNYRYVPNPHRWTARGHVEPADAETAREDARTNELLSALGRSME